MRNIIFSAVALISFNSFANTTETSVIGCDELTMIYEHTTSDEVRSEAKDILSDVEQAYQTLCREKHTTGEAVYYPNGRLATDSYNSESATLYYPNSAVMAEQDDGGYTVWYFPNGDTASDNPDVLWNILNGVQRKAAKIEAPFKAQHAKCAKGCTYVSWGIWGDLAHKKRKSCHNSGEAIDIHAIKCGKTTSGPKTAKFKSYVGCMRNKFKVIFQVKDHYNHAHIQIPNCRKIKIL